MPGAERYIPFLFLPFPYASKMCCSVNANNTWVFVSLRNMCFHSPCSQTCSGASGFAEELAVREEYKERQRSLSSLVAAGRGFQLRSSGMISANLDLYYASGR